MKLIKWEHACLDIGLQDQRLLIDPSGYAKSLTDFSAITAVVITHVHQDHYSKAILQTIVAKNPAAKIFSTQEVADDAKPLQVTVVKPGQTYSAGLFNLEFFGGQHAIVNPAVPPNQNFGVLVNDTLYYPGDSLDACPKPHKVLALPVMAPWLKVSETLAFIPKNSADLLFPTHNGFINEEGQNMYNRIVGGAAQQDGRSYRFLAPGETLEL
jgi:L-ascorbate metabolism protein UlaG (beta-lactamase superfamily)